MNLKIVKQLDHCPKDPACNAKKLFENEDGELLRVDTKMNFFVHQCSTKGRSETPAIVWMSEWFNPRTLRTRYVGPKRLRKSAEKPPADGSGTRRNNGKSDWELRGIYKGTVTWEPVSD